MSPQRRGPRSSAMCEQNASPSGWRLVGAQPEVGAAARVDDPVDELRRGRGAPCRARRPACGARAGRAPTASRRRRTGTSRRSRPPPPGSRSRPRTAHYRPETGDGLTAGHPSSRSYVRAMKLATFLAPGRIRAAGRRGARRRDRRLRRAAPCSTASPPATARPPTAPAYRAGRRDAARAGPAPARDLRHRPQLRRPHRRDRRRAAREAARLPQAAQLERAARPARCAPDGRPAARLRGRAGAW